LHVVEKAVSLLKASMGHFGGFDLVSWFGDGEDPFGLEWAGDLHVIATDAVEAYYLVFWGNVDGYVEVGYVGGLAQ
jgi:hypothetical protein